MKLRNKTTGEIVHVWEIVIEGRAYNSLAEIKEDYEDIKPAEPLIKDEKIRKAVRAWAKTFGFRTFRYVWNDEKKPAYGMLFGELSGEYPSATYRIDVPFDLKLDSSKCYTLDELLSDGEEEE